ncbi:MAG: hypothetical protein ACFBQW_04520 [Sphingomonadaceae bacterium]
MRLPVLSLVLLLIASCGESEQDRAARDAAIATAAGVDAAAGGEAAPAGRCEAMATSEWTAFLDREDGGPLRLVVQGKVTTAAAGYRVALEEGPLRGRAPPVKLVRLLVEPPRGPAAEVVTGHDVRGEFPGLRRYSAVVVMCGDEELARISDISVRE